MSPAGNELANQCAIENLPAREHLAKQIAIQNIQIEKLYEQLDQQSELLQAYQAQIRQLKQELSLVKQKR